MRVFAGENFLMSNDYLSALFLGAVLGGAIAYWIAYRIGRLHGYHFGLEKGAESAAKVQHLRGMTDGYVMSIQHTPEQRAEYMNNVLLKVGAITPADVEADRRRRLELEALG
jgi:hypothetical protein